MSLLRNWARGSGVGPPAGALGSGEVGASCGDRPLPSPSVAQMTKDHYLFFGFRLPAALAVFVFFFYLEKKMDSGSCTNHPADFLH